MRRIFLKGLAATTAVALSLGAGAMPSVAETAAEFYKGKKVKFIVPYKPGGGYDEYARLLAPSLEKQTGARVEIVNMPGSGGMKGANEIFNSPADGLTIGIINGSAMVTNELAGIKGADYRVADYNFLGRVVADQRVLAVSTKSGIETYDDMLKSDKPILLGATGLGGSTYVDAVVIGQIMGNNQKVIHGFNSSSDVRQALLRGDIQGMWGSYGSARKGVQSGDFRIVTHSAKEGSKNTPDIPSVFEFAAKTADPAKSEEILEAWDALSAVGRPVAAPPGVPEDRIEFLQAAFSSAMEAPEFVDKAKKAKREVEYIDGKAMAALAKKATQLTPEIKDLFVAAIRGEI
ncbi:hypothetical protein BV394_07020 [Brevirhabdus pacifica]|uniref:Uncharacterized protein n=1 Tax=Brevirhabdus pacifica TaxID=1267768 RepID=A0A1U7DHL6_9RHOB|nr:tripartite tricarboxylate transporter substrate-binding protein [Brevirhabdus pacifica]APX89497.1 hypothetical protein BV394_07020 [Brevirhabdus pacifica]OWU76495.1 hypothetical protein ATO5_09280 [Loktanella sp. 22II-4b]PJJ85851.1 tripartite-type tricarboxylate transporter receptor subunit TctC [Brevirhabdus pacifica]